MAEAALQPMPVAESLAFDAGTDTRYALVGGKPVAMNPPRVVQVEITTRRVQALLSKLRPPCGPFVGGGLANSVDSTNYCVPDIFVTGTAPSSSVFFDRPRLIVETLSPATEADDRGTKLDFYTTYPSLQAILRVWQAIRRIELHERGGDVWIVEELIGSGRVVVDNPGLALDMDDIYRDRARRQRQGSR